jgi:hypothetical protein
MKKKKTKEAIFLDDYVDDLGIAVDLLEAHTIPSVEERLKLIFRKYPQMKKLFHWQLAILAGTTRESVGRYMMIKYPRRKKKGKKKHG